MKIFKDFEVKCEEIKEKKKAVKAVWENYKQGENQSKEDYVIEKEKLVQAYYEI